MSLFYKIDRLAFIKVITIAFILTVVFSIPVAVILVQQRTDVAPEAYYQKPEFVPKKEILLQGPIPSNSPQIGRVFPWVGKIGDVIWIQGENFGNNPVRKTLIIGGEIVLEDYITSWRDTEIQAIIPQGARQGGTAEVKIDKHPVSTSLPIVLYDKNTKIKLRKKGNIISTINGKLIDKVKVWTGDESMLVEAVEIPNISVSLTETPLFDTKGKPLLTIVLFDKDGQVLSYYVDPVEFGF